MVPEFRRLVNTQENKSRGSSLQSAMLKVLAALLSAQLLLGFHVAAAHEGSDQPPEAPNRPRLGLVDSGASPWTVVVPDECTPLEREAASQLVDFLAEAAGATLPVRREAGSDG